MEPDPLSQLRDIHLPEPGGFWPPAPGWWLLALIAIIAVAVLVAWLIQRHQRNRWLRSARQELAQLADQSTRDNHWYRELNSLLKRCARHRYPERRPDALSGEAWQAFLLETGELSSDHLNVLKAMSEAVWQPRPDCDGDAALSLARTWLRRQSC